MKRVISILITCLLLAGLLGSIPVSAAKGSLSVTASSTAVTVGQDVTITLTYDGGGEGIGNISGTLTYDADLFRCIDCYGSVDLSGTAGNYRFTYFATEVNAPTSVTVTFVFRAKAIGGGTFDVSTDDFFNDYDSSLGTPSDWVTVAVGNPTTLSGNANLISLVPTRGTLSPAFDPTITRYTITVPYEVTSLSLSTTAAHSAASISISGKSTLEVGQNTRTITVTAPNGTTKTYTVVITRAAYTTPATTPTATAPTESTTTTSTTKPHTTTGKSDTTQSTTRQPNAVASVSDDPTAGADTSGATDNEDTPAVTKPRQTTRASSASKETTDNGSVGKTIAIAGLLITIVCVAVGITAIVKHKYDT